MDVLIRYDGARSAARAPYFLATPKGNPALPQDNGRFRCFAYKRDAIEYVREHGSSPVDDTGADWRDLP